MKRIASAALLVRSVAVGESDLVATFFTESDGKLSTVIRGARRSSKRFGGALEPMHELEVVIEDRNRELCTLREARLVRPRTGLLGDLAAMEAAGRALRWVRHLCPARTPEPAAWRSIGALLDTLDARTGRGAAQEVAAFGVGLLADVGYALDFQRCVSCGRPCPPGRSAFLDTTRGGLVCTACGGARRTISAEVRELAARLQHGEASAMTPAQATELIVIVEEAMAAHAGFDGA